MAVKMLDRLRFPRGFIEDVAHLIRSHMFYYNIGEISPAGVRRFVARVGTEYIDDLFKSARGRSHRFRCKKSDPYRLRHMLFMIEKVKHDPLSPKMLKLNGDEIMELLQLPQSPRVGWILNALLEEVLDDPKKNIKESLTARAKQLGKLSDGELQKLFASAREKKSTVEDEIEEDMKKKFYVK